jgi:predicted nucleotide-binding protein
VGKPSISASQAIPPLSGLVAAARGVSPGDRNAYEAWLTQARHWIGAAFGENSQNRAAFEMAGPPGIPMVAYASRADIDQHLSQELEAKVGQLQAFIGLLEQTQAMSVSQDAAQARTSPGRPNSKRVFVVHGTDDGAKQTVARYLEKIDLEPVILHEQPNKGMTIIEKFETYSDVAFAVVLLTPDDPGATGAPSRPRQNVLLELGYFLGKLGRSGVCALFKEGTDIPSDFQGVLFVPMDPAGAWHLLLARELKQVLPEVDLNKAIAS